MNTKEICSAIRTDAKGFAKKIETGRGRNWNLRQPRIQGSAHQDPRGGKSLHKAARSLAVTYLTANLNSRVIPLKDFMDSFEKRILLTCLRLTRNNQKNAAAILHIKPTSLIEKMRKHGIKGRRRKLSAAPLEPPQ